MYLDTDIILALVKDKDWLKPYIDFKKLEEPKTSTFTIVEAEIVLSREHGRKEMLSALDKTRKLKIDIVNFDAKILEKSVSLLEKYPKLNIFDSVHAASALVLKEQLLSTDVLFDIVEGVERVDPRDLK